MFLGVGFGFRGVAFGQQVQIPREEALYVAGFQWGPPTTDNPFTGSPMTFVSNPGNISGFTSPCLPMMVS